MLLSSEVLQVFNRCFINEQTSVNRYISIAESIDGSVENQTYFFNSCLPVMLFSR